MVLALGESNNKRLKRIKRIVCRLTRPHRKLWGSTIRFFRLMPLRQKQLYISKNKNQQLINHSGCNNCNCQILAWGMFFQRQTATLEIPSILANLFWLPASAIACSLVMCYMLTVINLNTTHLNKYNILGYSLRKYLLI